MLDAGAGYVSYLWSNGDTSQQITVTTPNKYYVYVKGAGGCSGVSDTVTVSLSPKLSPKISASGQTTFCAGDSVILNANAGYASYRWQNGDTTQSIVSKTSGTYFVDVTNANGCTGTSDTVTVNVISNPSPTITATGSLSFCTGDSVILNATGGYASYHWSNGETTQSTTVKQTDT